MLGVRVPPSTRPLVTEQSGAGVKVGLLRYVSRHQPAELGPRPSHRVSCLQWEHRRRHVLRQETLLTSPSSRSMNTPRHPAPGEWRDDKSSRGVFLRKTLGTVSTGKTTDRRHRSTRSRTGSGDLSGTPVADEDGTGRSHRRTPKVVYRSIALYGSLRRYPDRPPTRSHVARLPSPRRPASAPVPTTGHTVGRVGRNFCGYLSRGKRWFPLNGVPVPRLDSKFRSGRSESGDCGP